MLLNDVVQPFGILSSVYSLGSLFFGSKSVIITGTLGLGSINITTITDLSTTAVYPVCPVYTVCLVSLINFIKRGLF